MISPLRVARATATARAYAVCMASIPLTLAALATSAVPGLQVVGTRTHSFDGEGAFASAVVATEDAELIVRVPRNSAAEVQQSAEMLGLAALAGGARAALPFAVPEVLGVTRAGETRAVVSTFLAGGRVSAEDLSDDALLLQPIAESIATIHQLPTSLVQQAGLPVRSAEEARQSAARIVERAAETRLLPDTVHGRWLGVLGSARFWDFAPTVVHGSLDAEQLLIVDDQITGVLGWNELSVGDPATDLSWLLAAGHDVLEVVIARYAERREGGRVELQARASFYHELELARWLLHGIDTHDAAVVDDAISMMDRLVDRLTGIGDPVPVRPATTASEAERVLEETPEVTSDPRSETAEFESLDEDRAFGEGDFGDTAVIEPLKVDVPDDRPADIIVDVSTGRIDVVTQPEGGLTERDSREGDSPEGDSPEAGSTPEGGSGEGSAPTGDSRR